MNRKFTAVALAVVITTCMAAVHFTRRPAGTVHDGSPAAPTNRGGEIKFRVMHESHADELAARIVRNTSSPAPVARKKSPGRVHLAHTQSFRGNPLPIAPEAREALSYVGADEVATEIWTEAINDPSIPPMERQDLIANLNEHGFPDPSHVTTDDLPLILSRLALIEELAPDSLDEVNAAAFEEAYKELTSMVDRLAQQ